MRVSSLSSVIDVLVRRVFTLSNKSSDKVNRLGNYQVLIRTFESVSYGLTTDKTKCGVDAEYIQVQRSYRVQQIF